MRAVFDTNIIIDYLNGIVAADKELKRFVFKSISIISYIETLVGCAEHKHANEVRAFLNTFHVLDVDHAIADLAIGMCREYRLKVPDAIVLAIAQHTNAVLVTRNTKDFLPRIPIRRVPYTKFEAVS